MKYQYPHLGNGIFSFRTINQRAGGSGTGQAADLLRTANARSPSCGNCPRVFCICKTTNGEALQGNCMPDRQLPQATSALALGKIRNFLDEDFDPGIEL